MGNIKNKIKNLFIKIKNNRKYQIISLVSIFLLISFIGIIYKSSAADSNYTASDIIFNPVGRNFITATTVQDAIDELNSKINGQSFTPSNNVTCSETEEISYTINFDANGGEKPSGLNNLTVVSIDSADSDVNIPSAIPTKEGYTFTGWSTSGTDEGTKYTSGTTYKLSNFTFDSSNSVTLKAIWSTTAYTITYNLNGGTVSENPNSYTTSDTITLNNPSKEGYTFTGWTGSNGNTPSTTVTIPQGSTGDKNYIANWTASSYTITYDLDGGTVSGNPTSYNIESNNITLNNPSKEGYTFTGWTGSNGNTPSTTVTINKGSTGDKNYIANWTASSYTITYDLDGGTVSGNPTSYNIDTNTITLKNPIKNGYTFTGWTGSNGTISSTTVTIPQGSTGNKSYKANWTVISYTITYDLDGGTVSGNATSYNIESNNITLNNPTKEGYTFTGWTGSNGNTPSTTVTINKGTIGDKNYKANWRTNSYTITYDLDGGTVSGNPTSYSIETNNIVLNNPTKKNYTFTGWTGSNGNTPSTTITIPKGSTGNKNYKANWQILPSYKVTFDSNGGSSVPEQSVISGNTIIKPSNPTKKDYNFYAWYKDKDYTLMWDFAADIVTNNITLYAKWTKKTLSSNGGSTAEYPELDPNNPDDSGSSNNPDNPGGSGGSNNPGNPSDPNTFENIKLSDEEIKKIINDNPNVGNPESAIGYNPIIKDSAGNPINISNKDIIITTPIPEGWSSTDNIKVFEVINGICYEREFIIKNDNIKFTLKGGGKYLLVKYGKNPIKNEIANSDDKPGNNDEKDDGSGVEAGVNDDDIDKANSFNPNKVPEAEEQKIKDEQFPNALEIDYYKPVVKDKNGNIITDPIDVTYSVPIPKGYNVNDNIVVYEITNGVKKQINFVIKDGKLVFTIKNGSEFAVVIYPKVEISSSNNDGNTIFVNNDLSEEIDKFNIDVITDNSKIKEEYFEDSETIFVIDITLKDKNGKDIDLNGREVIYSINLPKGMSQGDNIKVYNIIDGQKIEVEFEIRDGKIFIKAKTTGRFAIVKYPKNYDVDNPKTGNIDIFKFVVGSIVCIIAIIVSIIFIKKNKERK